MSVLGINCAAENISIAVLNKGKIIEKNRQGKTIKAEDLLLFIDELLQETKLSIKDIKKIGIAIGPGAFTGLRLSLVTAKTLCLENNIPLIPISTLNGLAFQNKRSAENNNIRVILKACRGEVSTALFDKDLNRLEADHPAFKDTISDSNSTYIIEDKLPSAQAITEIADQTNIKFNKDAILKLAPAYSHEARVQKSGKKELQNLKIGINNKSSISN